MIPDVIHNLPDPELHCNATWPGVHPTPGFTAIATVPGCGLHREARASPHPPTCAGYRTGYMKGGALRVGPVLIDNTL